MTKTENFNLNIVEGTDIVNPLVQDVPNYKIIDAQMFENQNAGIQVATELKSGTVHAITRSVPDAPMFRYTATSNWVSGDTMTVDGIQVNVLTPSGETLNSGAYVINATVIGVIVGSLVTLYVQSTDIASDSEKLGGELPSYYATAEDLASAKSVADAAGDLAQTNNTNLNQLQSNLESGLFRFVPYSLSNYGAANVASGGSITFNLTDIGLSGYNIVGIGFIYIYSYPELVPDTWHFATSGSTTNFNSVVLRVRNTGSSARYCDGQIMVQYVKSDYYKFG